MSGFDVYAGQEVASGIRTNEPVIAFEDTANASVLANLQMIGGLVPKISRVIVRETRVKEGNLNKYFKKISLPYGVGFEDAQFMNGATNKKVDGRCIPYGNVPATSQMNLVNLAWNFEVSVYDREINKAVLSPEEASQYVGQKMRAMEKGYTAMRRNAEIQLISDVIDGTRSITSTDQSDGQGTTVTYSPTITGYAGQVENSGIVLDELTQGTVPAFASASDALDVVKKLENAAAEMQEEGTAYSALGISTFTLDRPLLIMETRTLNALDNAWSMDGTYQGIPTRTAREFMGRFADLVEIPKFAELPTNANYTGKRLGAVLLDRDSLTEAIQWADTEAQRCVKLRSTNYSMAGASALSVYRGNPAYAMTFDLPSP